MALKLKEDQLLYPLLENLDQLKRDWEQSAGKYHLSGVKTEDCQRWVKSLSDNLTSQPTLETQLSQLKKYALSTENIQAMGEAFKRIPAVFESESKAALERAKDLSLPEILLT